MIKVSVARLEKEPVVLEGTEGREFWGLPESDPYQPESDVTYSLTARYVSGSILVSGSVRGRVGGSCGRCLAPVSAEVVNSKVELYYNTQDLQSEELDITEDLREELLLELPMNLLCSPDCKGLCPRCGADLNHEKCKCTASGSVCWNALDDFVPDK